MEENDNGLARILELWTGKAKGQDPKYHHLVRLQIRQNWPALAYALDAAWERQ